MSKRYYQLDWTSSRMFEYSATNQGDEWDEHTNTKGKVSYRRYANKGVTGQLMDVGLMDSKIGQQLVVTLKDELGDYNKLQFSLYDQRGMVQGDFVEDLIIRLGNLTKGTTYTFFTYNLSAEDQEQFDTETEGREVKDKYYDRRGLSIKTEGEKVPMYLTYSEGEPNSIPRIEWKPNPAKKGSKKPSAASMEVKSDFLLTELMRCAEGHLAYVKGSTPSPPSAPTPAAKKLAANEAAMSEPVDISSLPF